MVIVNDMLLLHWQLLVIGENEYLLQETSHAHHEGVFTAPDRAAAIDYCVVIFKINFNHIK